MAYFQRLRAKQRTPEMTSGVRSVERVYKSLFLYPSIFNGSGLSFCDSSRNRLQILQLIQNGFRPGRA